MRRLSTLGTAGGQEVSGGQAGGASPDHRARECQRHQGMWSTSALCLSVGRSDLQTQLAAGGKSDGRIADHMTEVDMSLNLVGMGSDASDTNLHK